MYAWEKPFQLVVKLARAYEMTALKKSIFVRSMFLGFMLFTERSIMFITVLTLALSGTMISATIVNISLSYLNFVSMNDFTLMYCSVRFRSTQYNNFSILSN